MKLIEITLQLECCDDVPAHVLTWMAENLKEHAACAFGDQEYRAGRVDPAYFGPPLADEGGVSIERVVTVQGVYSVADLDPGSPRHQKFLREASRLYREAERREKGVNG